MYTSQQQQNKWCLWYWKFIHIGLMMTIKYRILLKIQVYKVIFDLIYKNLRMIRWHHSLIKPDKKMFADSHTILFSDFEKLNSGTFPDYGYADCRPRPLQFWPPLHILSWDRAKDCKFIKQLPDDLPSSAAAFPPLVFLFFTRLVQTKTKTKNLLYIYQIYYTISTSLK